MIGQSHIDALSPPDEVALGLFRRAICEQNDAAWTEIVARYSGLVLATIRRHPGAHLIGEDDAYWVNRTFQRFWSAMRSEPVGRCRDLPRMLAYLKLCALSVLMDDLRANQRTQTIESERLLDCAVAADDAERVADRLDAAQLWATVRAVLNDDTERLVARLSFVAGMPPREIFERYGDRFASVNEVYRIKRNLLDRLRRAPELQRYVSRAQL